MTTTRVCIVPTCGRPALATAERCRRHERVRVSSRRYRREKAAAVRAEREAGSLRCSHRHGPHGECGGKLEPRQDRMTGAVTFACPLCERRRAGVCQDCPRRVAGRVGKSLRCEGCHRLHKREWSAEWRAKHSSKARESSRRYYQGDPERREHRNEYKRLYRQAFPTKVRRQKRRQEARNAKWVRAYQRRYKKQNAERLAEYWRLRRAGQLPPRSCLDCPTVVTGRAKLCDGCREARKRGAYQALQRMVAA